MRDLPAIDEHPTEESQVDSPKNSTFKRINTNKESAKTLDLITHMQEQIQTLQSHVLT